MTISRLLVCMFSIISLWHIPGACAAEPDFSDPALQESYRVLIKEMRCVTCPNQNIADSQAPIAQAMREEIYRRLKQGESSDSIRQYLLERYGDYVSYKPTRQTDTWLLWWGPLVFLLLGITAWWLYFAKRSAK